MISTEEALERVFDLLSPLGAEDCPIAEAAGRILAAPIIATRNQPPFAASAMDGYAVKSAEVHPGASFRVIGQSAAGAGFTGAIGPGEALRIFTGAPVPEGADRIVIQEDTIQTSSGITLRDTLDEAPYIRPAGNDFKAGEQIEAPARLTPSLISLAASMGARNLQVARRPVVAVMATGDELVMPGEVPAEDQIIASNTLGLAALLREEGAIVRALPIARDNAENLTAAFHLAKGADLIVTTGGASVGDHDLVRPVAASLGMEPAFYKVAMRPGKPLMAGRVLDIPMIGLPGNPVSSMVCGHVFLRPAIRLMLGLGAAPLPRRRVALAAPVGANGPRAHYMRATLTADGVTAATRQDSALLSVLAGANALIHRPPHDPAQPAGVMVEVLDL
ncbi:molybdopterin molybdotransferase MoeA [Alphaproteobacteria bacterium KMM 3653]|uniref:Molybdopterin molybdenumtransferase n=1 Tax=Harenicola maris TaxID=2841044 RepID=A0AAP2G743_9RHOB|nr:molybdopterin molybdotransferase MoeA [Harenicola maris]